MGTGASSCSACTQDDNATRCLSTVGKLPFLPDFEDRPPFQPPQPLCEADSAMLMALTHHRTPFAVVDVTVDTMLVVYASGGFVVGIGSPVESIEGTGVAEVLKGIKPSAKDVELVKTALQSGEDTSIVVVGSTGKRNSRNVPYTQFFATPIRDAAEELILSILSLQPVAGLDAHPSQTMPFRFRQAWKCLNPSPVWNLFTPYKTLCESDTEFVRTLQERREMFCITDPQLYDNPIVFVSDDFVDMTGYSRAEINGINCRFLQGEMTATEDVDVIRYGLQENSDVRVCLLNYRQNGTAFLNQFNLCPLRDDKGDVAYFIGVQIEVEDAEVLPFPTTRFTLQSMVSEDEEEDEDFWEGAELAPSQERATFETAVIHQEEKLDEMEDEDDEGMAHRTSAPGDDSIEEYSNS